jgi:hypothetical protein
MNAQTEFKEVTTEKKQNANSSLYIVSQKFFLWQPYFSLCHIAPLITKKG